MTRDQLVCALWSYEMDAPHRGETGGHFPPIDAAELTRILASPHEGDCTGVAAPCLRCYTEEIAYKAEWIMAQSGREPDGWSRKIDYGT